MRLTPEEHSRTELFDQVLDEEMPRYADAHPRTTSFGRDAYPGTGTEEKS